MKSIYIANDPKIFAVMDNKLSVDTNRQSHFLPFSTYIPPFSTYFDFCRQFSHYDH